MARAPSVALAGACALLLALAGSSVAQETGVVTGRVVDAGGEAVAGAHVSLTPGGPEGTSSDGGVFRLEAEPGDYLLRATFGNRTAEAAVRVGAGNETMAVLVLPTGGGGAGGLDPFPFVFLGLSMVAVVVGGFYVNKRMSETGVEFDKSVLGGARARKPFRRRRRPKDPPPSP